MLPLRPVALAVLLCAVAAHGFAVEVPPLAELLKQADEASVALMESPAEDDELLKIGVSVSLATTYARLGNQDKAAAALARGYPAEQRQGTFDDINDLLVEFTGVVPTLPDGLSPVQQLQRRRSLIIGLTRRGDWQGVAQQIELLPEVPQKINYVLREWKSAAEKQAKRGQTQEAKASLRKAWAAMQELSGEEADYKASWAVGIALVGSRLGDPKLSSKLAESTEALLRERMTRPADKNGFDDVPKMLCDLAKVYASAGTAEQSAKAASLLDEARQQLDQQPPERKQDPARDCEYWLDSNEVLRTIGREGDARKARQQAAAAARQVDKRQHQELVEFADKFDPSGTVSTFLELGRASKFSVVVLAQLHAGDEAESLKTWEQMPRCMQKMLVQLDMLQYFQKRNRADNAAKCVARILSLEDDKTPAGDLIAIYVLAAKAWQELGEGAQAKEVFKRLAAHDVIRDSPQHRAQTAREAADLGLVAESYTLIQTIPNLHDRALPLARLADKVAGETKGKGK